MIKKTCFFLVLLNLGTFTSNPLWALRRDSQLLKQKNSGGGKMLVIKKSEDLGDYFDLTCLQMRDYLIKDLDSHERALRKLIRSHRKQIAEFFQNPKKTKELSQNKQWTSSIHKIKNKYYQSGVEAKRKIQEQYNNHRRSIPFHLRSSYEKSATETITSLKDGLIHYYKPILETRSEKVEREISRLFEEAIYLQELEKNKKILIKQGYYEKKDYEWRTGWLTQPKWHWKKR